MRTEQSYNYTGSTKIDLNDVDLKPNGLALFDTKTGVGGIDYMPYDGATVLVTSGLIGTDPDVKDFNPSLNNTAYYLVTDTEYTENDKDTIISLATPIVMALSGGRYIGTFVFNNPSNYEYLYLIWDHTDSLSSGTGAYSGGAATRYIDVDFGATIGNAGIDYVVNNDPCRFVLEWNGATVGDTGYVGLNSVANYNALIAAGVATEDIKLQTPLDGLVDNGTDTMTFNKFDAFASATLTVYGPLGTTDWSVTRVLPTLTSFYLDITNGTLANVCAQTPATQKWHDGAATLPVIGDRVYNDATGAALFDGGNAYHIKNATALGAPPVSGGVYSAIDTEGQVYIDGECDCADLVEPSIDQDDLEFIVGSPVDIIISATDNPTSWTIDGACEKFELTGGTKGSIYSVTFCNGATKNVSVNVGSTVIVSATTATLTFGDGAATSVGVDPSFYLPKGLTFEESTGRLYGIPEDTCSFSVDFIASNCYGPSTTETVVMTVASGIPLTPFLIDVENISTAGAAACLITPTYSMLYHTGTGDTPDLGDYIYTDPKGIEPLMGGSRWYNVGDSLISIEVCENGKVCSTHTC